MSRHSAQAPRHNGPAWRAAQTNTHAAEAQTVETEAKPYIVVDRETGELITELSEREWVARRTPPSHRNTRRIPVSVQLTSIICLAFVLMTLIGTLATR